MKRAARKGAESAEDSDDLASHPAPVVRVTGYSAIFPSLSKEYRRQVAVRFLVQS